MLCRSLSRWPGRCTYCLVPVSRTSASLHCSPWLYATLPLNLSLALLQRPIQRRVNRRPQIQYAVLPRVRPPLAVARERNTLCWFASRGLNPLNRLPPIDHDSVLHREQPQAHAPHHMIYLSDSAVLYGALWSLRLPILPLDFFSKNRRFFCVHARLVSPTSPRLRRPLW